MYTWICSQTRVSADIPLKRRRGTNNNIQQRGIRLLDDLDLDFTIITAHIVKGILYYLCIVLYI